ncbi:MAG: GDSL-type esterase/lipase family protein [Weeksellaceae bacterium]
MKISKKTIELRILSMVLLLIPLTGCAQNEREIKNDTVLWSFFDKIKSNQQQNDRVITIVHIGDSHLQAGILPEEIRNRLQQEFGNSGYGFTFPYLLAKTNGTDLIEYKSNIDWLSQRIVFENLGFPVGLSGIAFFTDRSDFYLNLKVKDPKYEFNQIRIFSPDNPSGFRISQTQNENQPELKSDSFQTIAKFKDEITAVSLIPDGNNSQYALNGLILENGKPGILYHSIGVNGAKFIDYNKYPLFFDQLADLKPDLIIISLGTNTAFDKEDYSVLDFENHINEFFINLKSRNIDAPMLVTTPPPALRSKSEQNPKVPEFGDDLIRRSEQLNYAVWDLYRFLGGYENSQRLISEELWSEDRIHFSEKGYKQQGAALADAIINSYREYQKSKD